VEYAAEFDTVTFEAIMKYCEWEVRSIKVGEWKYFDRKRRLIDRKKEVPKFEIRAIEMRLQTSQQVLEQLNRNHRFRQ